MSYLHLMSLLSLVGNYIQLFVMMGILDVQNHSANSNIRPFIIITVINFGTTRTNYTD